MCVRACGIPISHPHSSSSTSSAQKNPNKIFSNPSHKSKSKQKSRQSVQGRYRDTKLPEGFESIENILAQEALESCGKLCSAVRILPVHDMMVPLDDLHPGGGDCRHWCQPGPILEWVNLLFLLLQNKTNNNLFIPKAVGKMTFLNSKSKQNTEEFLETYGTCTKSKQLQACKERKNLHGIKNSFYSKTCCQYFGSQVGN